MTIPPLPLRPAVFLDRDGTIIEDRGHLRDPKQVEFLPGALDALRALSAHYALFIVTNQSGVSSGRVTHAEVEAVNAAVVSELHRHGVEIGAVYVCPHTRAEGCVCIKPKSHFPERAAQEHGLDLRRSYTIGDHPHDAELATAIGATGIYVLTGHGHKHRDELKGWYLVVEDLAEAARWILLSRCAMLL